MTDWSQNEIHRVQVEWELGGGIERAVTHFHLGIPTPNTISGADALVIQDALEIFWNGIRQSYNEGVALKQARIQSRDAAPTPIKWTTLHTIDFLPPVPGANGQPPLPSQVACVISPVGNHSLQGLIRNRHYLPAPQREISVEGPAALSQVADGFRTDVLDAYQDFVSELSTMSVLPEIIVVGGGYTYGATVGVARMGNRFDVMRSRDSSLNESYIGLNVVQPGPPV